MLRQRTQVVVIGAGPAGLTVAHLLRDKGIDCVLLEERTRAAVETRHRAGIIEEWAVRALERHGLAERLLRTAESRRTFEFRFDNARHTFPYAELSGQRHFVHPQRELVTELVAGYADEGGDARFEVRNVGLHGLTTDRPSVSYADSTGQEQWIDCDHVAGCDGVRGVTRRHLLPGETVINRHDYGIGWLTLLQARGLVISSPPRGR